MSKEIKLSPVIKWVGGKRQLLTEIKELMPKEYNHYYEPFIGGAALLLEVQPENATINDFNLELTNLYKTIKENPSDLIAKLKEHKKNHSEEYFYEIRKMDREAGYSKLSNVDKAARMIYLNKTGFNGLYRVNSKGYFNVPFGKYDNPSVLNEDNINGVHKYLSEKNVNILNGDFEKAVEEAKEGDFVYFDPPYMPLSATSSFVGYVAGGFGTEEQERLKNCCDKLTKKGVKFILSNSYCEYITNLYHEYNIKTVDARRSINSKADKRGAIKEVLIYNF